MPSAKWLLPGPKAGPSGFSQGWRRCPARYLHRHQQDALQGSGLDIGVRTPSCRTEWSFFLHWITTLSWPSRPLPGDVSPAWLWFAAHTSLFYATKVLGTLTRSQPWRPPEWTSWSLPSSSLVWGTGKQCATCYTWSGAGLQATKEGYPLR